MKILAVINKNDEIRRQSSSGGVFYALAQGVISEGGVVFGARFDENFDVVHGFGESLEDVRAFMRSKYVQSSVGTSYRDAERFLKDGRMVLFSGTPCQISALKKYLGKDYDNLITLDFICHGVPSRRVWREYIDELSRGRKIRDVNFRDKTEGWRVFSLKVEFEDGSVYRKNLETDIYTKGFLANLYLRPSCHHCKHSGFERVSDITIADFWGAHIVMPEMFDDKGTSVVIVRSDRVCSSLENYADGFEIREITKDMVRGHNHAVEAPCKPHSNRDEFFSKEYRSITKHIGGYVKDPPVRRLKKSLYGIKKKLMG